MEQYQIHIAGIETKPKYGHRHFFQPVGEPPFIAEHELDDEIAMVPATFKLVAPPDYSNGTGCFERIYHDEDDDEECAGVMVAK